MVVVYQDHLQGRLGLLATLIEEEVLDLLVVTAHHRQAEALGLAALDLVVEVDDLVEVHALQEAQDMVEDKQKFKTNFFLKFRL